MSWIGLVLVVLGLYVIARVVSALMKLAMWLLVVIGIYWFVAPLFGWPDPLEIYHVLGPH